MNMCGINGFNFVDKKILKRMNDSIKHRGPEQEGFFYDSRLKVSLGHRRLAIIELSEKGAQPKIYNHKGKKVAITFNGEIYNYQEVREELIKKGYKFSSNSDTEVILASYLEYGTNCVNKFNGMWAFCILDYQKNKLFLSRDRIGKKPLYYFFDGKKFIFSSEIKGILEHKIKKKMQKIAINLYFSLGFIPSPYSIYENIFKLEPRQNLIFDLTKKTLKKENYYDWPDFKENKDKKHLKEEFNKLMNDSVRLRMISDVPLGAFLSGGLDSSTVVNFTKQIKPDLNTYSIGFEGKYDETPEINITKNFFKTNHHHKYFRESDFKELLKKAFYYYDEPFSDPSMFPTLFLTKFAKEKLTVSLSGDGGDEIFGGYPRYRIALYLEYLRKINPSIRKMMMKLSPSERIKEGLKLSLLPREKFYSEAREKFYKPEEVKVILEKILKKCLKKTNGNLVEAIRMMDIYFYTLSDNFLTKVDRAAMANALEVRCPFLDYRLLEYSMTIPTDMKLSMKKDKILFKEIIKDFLPKAILNKRKKGFTPPINDWIVKEEYTKKIKIALEELIKKNILSSEWAEFYNKNILNKNSLVENNYKIRLFLFYEWYKMWVKS